MANIENVQQTYTSLSFVYEYGSWIDDIRWIDRQDISSSSCLDHHTSQHSPFPMTPGSTPPRIVDPSTERGRPSGIRNPPLPLTGAPTCPRLIFRNGQRGNIRRMKAVNSLLLIYRIGNRISGPTAACLWDKVVLFLRAVLYQTLFLIEKVVAGRIWPMNVPQSDGMLLITLPGVVSNNFRGQNMIATLFTHFFR